MNKKVKMNRPLLKRSIEIYCNYSVSYTDAYLVAYTLEARVDSFYSYDQGLDKVKEIKRLEP